MRKEFHRMRFALVLLLVAAPAFANNWRPGRFTGREVAKDAKQAAKEAKMQRKEAQREIFRAHSLGRQQAFRDWQRYRRGLLRDLRGDRHSFPRPDTTGMKRIL